MRARACFFFSLLSSFFTPRYPRARAPPHTRTHLLAAVVGGQVLEGLGLAVDVAAVDADVRRERLLRRRQLAAKPLRRRLLGQPLDVDARVLPLDELDAHGAGRVGERRAGEREVVRGPELVAEEGRGVHDRVADGDAGGGGVALDALDDEASSGGLGGGELEGEGLVDLDLKRGGAREGEEEGVESLGSLGVVRVLRGGERERERERGLRGRRKRGLALCFKEQREKRSALCIDCLFCFSLPLNNYSSKTTTHPHGASSSLNDQRRAAGSASGGRGGRAERSRDRGPEALLLRRRRRRCRKRRHVDGRTGRLSGGLISLKFRERLGSRECTFKRCKGG